MKGVSGVIANSAGTAEAFQKAGFQNVHVVRNGVDLERFENLPSRDELRDRMELPKDKTIVMYVGAFYAWKGVPLLLKAWRKHLAEDEDKELVLIGGTESEFPEETRGTPHTLVIPHVQSSQISACLCAADILVLPNVPLTEESVRFTSPIKLFEYMASGRPIIASDLPSIREIASDEKGLFTKTGDAGDLAKKIK